MFASGHRVFRQRTLLNVDFLIIHNPSLEERSGIYFAKELSKRLVPCLKTT
jgi:hypothetical protein